MNPALSEKSGLFHWIEERLMFKSDQMPRFSVAISFVLSFIGISCIGFQLGDSDLWFHLNEGRQLFATGTIPSTSFFSYIEPARHWVNYAWLFQSICYKIFIHTGYFGLILLRSLVYVFIGLIIYRIFSKDGTSNIIVNLAFVLCFLCVMPRSLVVRPHIFTYLFILLSICTFERKQKFWILPIIFLLEANIHGIAYPFLLLVWGAYFLEYYVQSKRRKDIGIDNKQLICAAIAPVFLLFSPQGYHILPLPFENAASFVRYYIMEMQPPSFSGGITFIFWPISGLLGSLRVFFVFFAFIIAVYFLFKRTLRVSHAVLMCGGGYLFFDSVRFQYECLFFILPVLSTFIRQLHFSFRQKFWQVTSFFVLFVPAGFFGVFAVEAGDYPLSFDSAPLVGGKFIYQLPKGQTILMEPSKAGYLAWKVYPKHKIFMDLELALFDDAIAFEAATFLYKPTVLLHHVERYKPSVIYLPLSGEKLSAFKTALQGYRPVFFDKFGIIYLRQDVACTFPSLSHLEMILSQQIDKSRFTPEEQEKFVADIERIASFDAKAFRAHVVLGNTYVAFGQPDKLLQTAETLLRHFPHQIAGYVFKAQALFLLGKNEEAVNYFKQAESKKGDFDRKVLGKNYYVALVALKRFEEAYEVLKKSFNPFYRETPYDILYEFAIGAVNARQYKDAKQFIDIALLATPNEDVAKRKELLRLRGVLHANSAEFQ